MRDEYKAEHATTGSIYVRYHESNEYETMCCVTVVCNLKKKINSKID